MSIWTKFFSGLRQLWKFDGKVLKNRKVYGGKWNFKTKDELIYIENDSYNKVFGTSNGAKVIEVEYEEGKTEQLWKIGKPNAEGYFTLENYIVSKFLTAASSTSLELKGNIHYITYYYA